MRLLIHYVGDAHQPCHSVARVDGTYPTGDKGCNSETIPSVQGAANLHAVWDSVIYEQPGAQTLPFTSTTWNSYGTTASSLYKTYTLTPSQYHDSDPAFWANENLEYSATLYGGVSVGKPLSAEYIASATTYAEKRIAWAGRRLANMVMSYYGSNQLFLQ